MNSLINEHDYLQFQGGYSYTPNEMKEFLSFIQPKQSYKILEFGAGSSTKILYDIIERFCEVIEYDTYETDETYKVYHKNVNTIMYNINEIDGVVTPDKKYDIIIVDGPTGVNRYKWYEKKFATMLNTTLLC